MNSDLEEYVLDLGETPEDVESVVETTFKGAVIITAWTKKHVIFSHDYDGCISLRSVPRHPDENGAGLIW
jgi:hypothetical protein